MVLGELPEPGMEAVQIRMRGISSVSGAAAAIW
jgi:hypothetical protein